MNALYARDEGELLQPQRRDGRALLAAIRVTPMGHIRDRIAAHGGVTLTRLVPWFNRRLLRLARTRYRLAQLARQRAERRWRHG